GGFHPRVPCYAGGIDLDFTLDALLRQTDDNLGRGFRAIKMKVGPPSLHEDVEPAPPGRGPRGAAPHRERGPRGLGGPTPPDAAPGQGASVPGAGLPVAAGENLHTLH